MLCMDRKLYQRMIVPVFDGIGFWAYWSEGSEEYWLSLLDLAELLGYGRSWLYGVEGGKKPSLLEGLVGAGFSGQFHRVRVKLRTGKIQDVTVISPSDFMALLQYAVDAGKTKARALQITFATLGFEDAMRSQSGGQALRGRERTEWFQAKLQEAIEEIEAEAF